MLKDRKIFGYFKIILTLISACAALYFGNWSNESILYDISVGVFSAMVLTWFIDEISSRIDEKKARENERKKILRAHIIIELYLTYYIPLFIDLVTPICRRNNNTLDIPENFSIADLKDLYRPSLRQPFGYTSSCIRNFYIYDNHLNRCFQEMLLNIDFKYYSELEEIINNFVHESLNNNMEDIILSYETNSAQCNSIMNDIATRGQSYAEQLEANNSDQNIRSNILFPYVVLYNSLLRKRDIIRRYQEYIDSNIKMQ